MFKIKKGFTLAEILITLAIIGTVSAMTIPSLVVRLDLDAKENSARINKTVRSITDATKQVIMLDSNTHSMASVTQKGGTAACTTADHIKDVYGKYLNFIKVCTASKQADCYKPTTVPTEFKSHSIGILADGTVLGFNYAAGCNLSGTRAITYKEKTEKTNLTTAFSGACVTVAVDVNGIEKPNTLQKDVFVIPVGKVRVK